MNTPKFTPGPWKVWADRVWTNKPSDEMQEICSISGNRGDRDANARLIAQSPTGYALAQAVVEWDDLRRIEYEKLRTDPNYPDNLDDLAQKMGPIRDNIVALARQFLTAVDGKEG